MKLWIALLMVAGMDAVAHPMLENFTTKPVLADLQDLKALNIPVLAKDVDSGVGYAVITPEMQWRLQVRSHQMGKCGGFEQLANEEVSNISVTIESLKSLSRQVKKELLYQSTPFRAVSVANRDEIAKAVEEVDEGGVQRTLAL